MFRSLSASLLIELYPGRLRLRHTLVQLSQVKRIGPGVRISETNIGTAVYKIKSFLRAPEIFFRATRSSLPRPTYTKEITGSLKETSRDRKDLPKDTKEIPISTLPRRISTLEMCVSFLSLTISFVEMPISFLSLSISSLEMHRYFVEMPRYSLETRRYCVEMHRYSLEMLISSV